MAENLVKFVYGTKADFDAATKDANTIYFVKDGDLYKIYKGDVLYNGTAPTIAGDLAQLKTWIGTLPVDSTYDDLIDYIDKTRAAGDKKVADDLKELNDALAKVAKTGKAEDVSIADAGSLIDATNVEAALQEIAGKVNTTATDAEISIVRKTGTEVTNSSNVSEYVFYQGGNAAEDVVGTIEIAKDLVATSGRLVDEDGEGNPGKFIEMTIANGTPFYVNVADLIEYNAVQSTGEITLTDTNHTITATVGEIAASKIIYQEADTSDPENPVAKQTVAQKINELEEALGDGISALHADVDAVTDASVTDSEKVAVVTGITEVDGVITAVDSIDVDKAGAASRAKAAVIGTSSDTYGANTIYGAKAYADQSVANKVNTLDADEDAALADTDTDEYAVAAMSGVTEENGKISAVDSVAVDKAGAATAVKNAVIGAATDTKDSDTIKGAKKYADSLVGDALTWGTLTSTPSGE